MREFWSPVPNRPRVAKKCASYAKRERSSRKYSLTKLTVTPTDHTSQGGVGNPPFHISGARMASPCSRHSSNPLDGITSESERVVL